MQTVNEKFIKQTDVLNSKFIAILLPLNDDNLFKEILKDVKAEYKKAKHYCYAYRVGMKSKSSDDGEPSGTAGRPLLEILHKKELNNIALIVVRLYFNGNKLPLPLYDIIDFKIAFTPIENIHLVFKSLIYNICTNRRLKHSAPNSGVLY